MGAGVSTRATIVAVLLIGAACLSSCAPQPHFDQSTVPQFTSGGCVDPDPNIRFQLIREGRCPYGAAQPSIIRLKQTKREEQTAPADLRDQLTWFICRSMRESYGDTTFRGNCQGEQQLKSLLFFELIPEINSSDPTVNMTIYGPSTDLAAKKPEYWERHKVSFQLIVASQTVVVSVRVSQMQKNRINLRHINFDDVLMGLQYEPAISEFQNKIGDSLQKFQDKLGASLQ